MKTNNHLNSKVDYTATWFSIGQWISLHNRVPDDARKRSHKFVKVNWINRADWTHRLAHLQGLQKNMLARIFYREIILFFAPHWWQIITSKPFVTKGSYILTFALSSLLLSDQFHSLCNIVQCKFRVNAYFVRDRLWLIWGHTPHPVASFLFLISAQEMCCETGFGK